MNNKEDIRGLIIIIVIIFIVSGSYCLTYYISKCNEIISLIIMAITIILCIIGVCSIKKWKEI